MFLLPRGLESSEVGGRFDTTAQAQISNLFKSQVLNLVAFVIVGAFVGCILCCLSIYVLLLRRRYAKYMMLEDSQSAANAVAPASIGVPDSPGNFSQLSHEQNTSVDRSF